MLLTDAGALANGLLKGDRRALARALTEIENQTSRGLETLRLIFPQSRDARVIGITGSAGSGKSTLTAGLARAYRRIGLQVGIVAVDPFAAPSLVVQFSETASGMQDLTSDGGIFLRSIATRGSVGGLSAATGAIATALAASGYDVVIIETVGAGQDEVEIAGVAQTTLVLNTRMGDDVQAIKAGIIEIADVLVVNKADLAGADAVASQLSALLSLLR